MKHANIEMMRPRVKTKHARIKTKRASVQMKHAGIETEHASIEMKRASIQTERASVQTEHASLRTQPARRISVQPNPYNFGEILSSGPGRGDSSSKSGAELENDDANCSRTFVESLYAGGVRGHQLPVTGSLSAVRFTRS
jgi:hypothetical protein